jgi:uncharacterized membrane protein
MDYYLLLRLGHIAGFILLGGGLLAVFVSELRAHTTDDVHVFAEAAWYTAIFYDALALPGALLVGLSGLLLIFELGLGFFEEPWLVGMWGLFLFEFVEGNTITRIEYRRTLRQSRKALAAGHLTPELRNQARNILGRFTHFLDLPLFAVIVYCGAMRPAAWGHVIIAILVAGALAAALTFVAPRLARLWPTGDGFRRQTSRAPNRDGTPSGYYLILSQRPRASVTSHCCCNQSPRARFRSSNSATSISPLARRSFRMSSAAREGWPVGLNRGCSEPPSQRTRSTTTPTTMARNRIIIRKPKNMWNIPPSHIIPGPR